MTPASKFITYPVFGVAIITFVFGVLPNLAGIVLIHANAGHGWLLFILVFAPLISIGMAIGDFFNDHHALLQFWIGFGINSVLSYYGFFLGNSASEGMYKGWCLIYLTINVGAVAWGFYSV